MRIAPKGLSGVRSKRAYTAYEIGHRRDDHMEMQRFGVEDVAQPGDMARGIRVNPVRARRLACTAKQGGPTKHQTTPVTAAGQMQHRGIWKRSGSAVAPGSSSGASAVLKASSEVTNRSGTAARSLPILLN